MVCEKVSHSLLTQVEGATDAVDDDAFTAKRVVSFEDMALALRDDR